MKGLSPYYIGRYPGQRFCAGGNSTGFPRNLRGVSCRRWGGAWRLFDPTGMADAGTTATIGVGGDAADVSFLTAYGYAELVAQSVAVRVSLVRDGQYFAAYWWPLGQPDPPWQ